MDGRQLRCRCCLEPDSTLFSHLSRAAARTASPGEKLAEIRRFGTEFLTEDCARRRVHASNRRSRLLASRRNAGRNLPVSHLFIPVPVLQVSPFLFRPPAGATFSPGEGAASRMTVPFPYSLSQTRALCKGKMLDMLGILWYNAIIMNKRGHIYHEMSVLRRPGEQGR